MENMKDSIQDYIDGLLDKEDLRQFEERLASDSELREEVDTQMDIQGIIQSRLESGEVRLRANLREAQSIAQGSKRKSAVYRMYIPIAAAACLLVFFSLFFFNRDDNSLYGLPTMQSEVVRGQDENVSYENAVKAFNNKSYGEARDMLNTLIAKDSTIVQYQYYAALTYFGEQNWSGAIRSLRPLAEGQSIFAHEAKYYLAASYLKNDQHQEAKAVLENMDKTGKLGEKVDKLLEEVQKK